MYTRFDYLSSYRSFRNNDIEMWCRKEVETLHQTTLLDCSTRLWLPVAPQQKILLSSNVKKRNERFFWLCGTWWMCSRCLGGSSAPRKSGQSRSRFYFFSSFSYITSVPSCNRQQLINDVHETKVICICRSRIKVGMDVNMYVHYDVLVEHFHSMGLSDGIMWRRYRLMGNDCCHYFFLIWMLHIFLSYFSNNKKIIDGNSCLFFFSNAPPVAEKLWDPQERAPCWITQTYYAS